MYWGKSIIGFLIMVRDVMNSNGKRKKIHLRISADSIHDPNTIQRAIGWYEEPVDIVITKIGFPVWEYKAGKKGMEVKG